MIGTCWSKIIDAQATMPGVLGFVAEGPLVALLLGALLAPIAPWAFNRSVLRFARFREVQAAPPAWWERRARRLRRKAAAAAASSTLAECVTQREERLRRATVAACLTFVMGGIMLAALGAFAQWDTDRGETAASLVFATLMAAWFGIVNLRPDGSKRGLLLAALAVGVVFLYASDRRFDPEHALAVFAQIGVVYVVTVHRTTRALAVPLMVLCMGAWMAVWLWQLAWLPYSCLASAGNASGPRWSNLAAGLLMDIETLALLYLAVMAAGLCLWLSARALDALKRLIERGWLGDLSLLCATGLTITACLLTFTAGGAAATPARKALFVLAWLGAVGGAYAWALRRQPVPQLGRSLLMLRVFTTDRGTERLLDAVQSRWALAGPVLQIAGPDMLKFNLGLNEVTHFVNFNTHDLFQPAAVPRQVLARSLDLAPDAEGRFRLNQVFCFDTSWQTVVEELLGLADVVLLDLRGFVPRREGTAHEVVRLAARGLLPRVVAVGNQETDWAFFDRCVGQANAQKLLALRLDNAHPEMLKACLSRLLQVADDAPLPPASFVKPGFGASS